ncbi:VOC family protein [Bdellovibrio sp. ZAP7]|uniref:VOC family protein n=1 Tax=Bdellovibrio sp. ZAP7 TaxID=2231053 RepID=UPI001159F2F3|nr:VOC family protein [Bdellovibrio sp. ZAP7]QDK47097.1 VOC family protein [Bdellovibrio sp. ZAP7]
METNELYRGRLIDHIQLVVKDLESSKKFYLPIFETLQIPIGGQGPDFFWVDELFISSKESKAANGALTGRVHLAFQAKDRAMVDKFHEVAMKSGGKDNGKPGERPYHPGYYGAFVIDPDGNNIEAVFHGPAKKSSEAIKITF